MVRDVGGLVDINSAAAPLIERLVAGLGADPAPVLAAVADRRRSPVPFRIVAELSEIERISPRDFELIAPHLTTYSGRRGVAPAAASTELLAAVAGRNVGRAALVETIPLALRTPPTGRVFAVSVWIETEEARCPLKLLGLRTC